MPSRTVSFSSTSFPEAGRAGGPPVGTEFVDDGSAPLRVFLVEDSASVRDRLNDYLAEPGKVELTGFAATEEDAVRQLDAQVVDVVIVDIRLKEGDGVGVIEYLRTRYAASPPTIIVLTNYAFPEFEAACRKRGADHFFDKSTQFGAVKVLLGSIRSRNR